jgi:hypothetical protein
VNVIVLPGSPTPTAASRWATRQSRQVKGKNNTIFISECYGFYYYYYFFYFLFRQVKGAAEAPAPAKAAAAVAAEHEGTDPCRIRR